MYGTVYIIINAQTGGGGFSNEHQGKCGKSGNRLAKEWIAVPCCQVDAKIVVQSRNLAERNVIPGRLAQRLLE